ncbi:MAG: glycosyltransferase family 2 protein [Magnetococcales bacterium]|nr:glycosyltransferase family 2 protein [Magnetococcales bacterium]
MKVAVVVPAFNEGKIIQRTLRALRGQVPRFAEAGLELNLWLVDDGSTDDTAQQAQEGGVDRVITHRRNQGLGAAVRSGFKAARQAGMDILIKFDADLQHDPDDLLPLLQPILRGEADVVYGNRFPRITYRMPLVRKAGNIVFTGLMRWLTGWPLEDGQPGLLAVNRAYLQCFYLPGDYNYTQQVLMDAYRKGMSFAHVPVAFHPRTTGKSFISFRYPFKVLPQIFMVLIAVRPLKVFAPIGLLFFLLGATLFTVEFFQWLLGDAPKPVNHVNLVLGLTLFGLQTLFFGVLAHLIVEFKNRE